MRARTSETALSEMLGSVIVERGDAPVFLI
jgi:hypothetical protein